MLLDLSSVEEFKNYLADEYNERVYYHLRTWCFDNLDEGQKLDDALDYFLPHLNHNIVWTNQ